MTPPITATPRTAPGRSLSPTGSPTGSQAGSAYIAALLVLVVLTVIGLSLALITQSEMQIGGNERVQQRMFYAANSGIAASTARALTNADYSSTTYRLGDVGGSFTAPSSFVRPGFDVEVSPFLPILESPCHLCEINQIGTYSERSFRAINHAVTVVAIRRQGPTGTTLAQKTLSSMIEVQPWRQTPDALEALTNPDELAKLRF
ncbi:MAG TPA: PilX N-terminal domain-containing pilus assembly protein [Thermoanaerobaculia bacterium]|nr:PilX N-terminal domain-containing pilus assembly protein [Thermoanaerobaculia bacterium]